MQALNEGAREGACEGACEGAREGARAGGRPSVIETPDNFSLMSALGPAQNVSMMYALEGGGDQNWPKI